MNNNNRYNGYTVRPVCPPQHLPMSHSYVLTREQLLSDLYDAYIEARRHKRSKPYVKQFESHLKENLEALCDELFNRTYKPRPSSCFIITDPKRREVFAAEFRDRIVHHLYYNYTHELFERTFIHDTYSCIKGRGTHFGISRLERHIRSESRNYTVPCYVMKMDVRGYFMHINRQRLYSICMDTLRKMSRKRVSKHLEKRWCDTIDMDFVGYLTHEIVLLDPAIECRIKGFPSDWADLPHDKSLFNSPEGCGLPIGNLTSQLFSNVYMNVFDQFMKRVVGCRHYGRYVDDFYVVSSDIDWLRQVSEIVRDALRHLLDLDFHEGKMMVKSVWEGVEFLGAWLKPHRIYATRGSVGRMRAKLRVLAESNRTKWEASLNSFCGVLSHGANYRLRRRLMLSEPAFTTYGVFDMEYRRYFCAF